MENPQVTSARLHWQAPDDADHDTKARALLAWQLLNARYLESLQPPRPPKDEANRAKAEDLLIRMQARNKNLEGTRQEQAL